MTDQPSQPPRKRGRVPLRDQPPWNTPDDVPKIELSYYRGLKSTGKKLNGIYGEGKWGDRELRSYIFSRRKILETEDRKEIAGIERKVKPYAQRVEAGFREYLKHIDSDTLTPNDRQSLYQMVDIGLQLEDIQRQRTLDPEMKVEDQVKLAQMQTKLSAEYRQLQSALGIDRASREQEIDAASEIARIVDGARKLLAEKGIHVYCPNCHLFGRKIRLGFIVNHFRELPWRFEMQCPKCQKLVVLKEGDFDAVASTIDPDNVVALLPEGRPSEPDALQPETRGDQLPV